MEEKEKILITWAVYFVICYILNGLGMKKMFRKAGAKEGTAWVPFVRFIKLIELCWTNKTAGKLWCVTLVLGLAGIGIGSYGNVQFLGWVGLICMIASVVLKIMADVRISHAFGRGGGTTAGLIFLNPLFNYVIGASASEYKSALDR